MSLFGRHSCVEVCLSVCKGNPNEDNVTSLSISSCFLSNAASGQCGNINYNKIPNYTTSKRKREREMQTETLSFSHTYIVYWWMEWWDDGPLIGFFGASTLLWVSNRDGLPRVCVFTVPRIFYARAKVIEGTWETVEKLCCCAEVREFMRFLCTKRALFLLKVCVWSSKNADIIRANIWVDWK